MTNELLERRRNILLVTVIVPLFFALLYPVFRLGGDQRHVGQQRDIQAAERVAAGGSATGYAVAWYSVRGGALAGDQEGLPAQLEAPVLKALALRDAGVPLTLRNHWRAAVAPVKDADGWNTVRIALVTPREVGAQRLPRNAFLLALLCIVVVAFGALRALAVKPEPRRILVLYVAPLSFAIYLLWAQQVAPAHESYRFWTIACVALWSVSAGIGVSLARSAERRVALRQAAAAWTFLAPSFLHILIFSLGPILFSLLLSFHEWNLIAPARPFVGLQNYRELAGDREFWHSVWNTAVYVLFVPAGMAVALALALLVNRRMAGSHVLRAIFFLPYITSFVAISLIWRWMFEPDFGLLNAALHVLHLPAQPWLSSPRTALPSLMLMSVWMYAGYMMIVFLAGLQSIPETLYESARLDGANAWQRFRHITLPMLKPTTLFVLITMVIFMFQVFTAVYVMTEGGPLHATDVIVYHIYRNAWEYLRMGYASAMAWVLFAIVFVITILQFKLLGEGGHRARA